ncbi:MAG TPA: DUF1634 domain-containing protein [Planctomycetota bacterium]|nr:DUF1634 domain-containing protein [Planctomycetota bacterium]
MSDLKSETAAPALPEADDPDHRVRKVELLISNLLRIGVIASMIVILIGSIVGLARHSMELSSPATFQRLTKPGAAFPHSLQDVGDGLRHFQGQAIITLGLLLLIATPVLRVLVSVFTFIYQRDRIFTAITALVFCLLILSFVLGKAG